MVHIYIDDYCGNELDGIYKLMDDIFEEVKEARIEIEENRCEGKRKTGKAYRRVEDRKKDKRRREIVEYTYYDDATGWLNLKKIDGKWVEVGEYIKYPKNSNRQRYLKKQSNKKVRRSDDISGKGNGYRRLF